MPDFSLENSHQGFVCGLDEVGRAPLAGPVVAACVYIPPEKYGELIWKAVNDSKKISKKRRAEMVLEIKAHSIFAIAKACPREIEAINIVQASFLAMRRSYELMAQKGAHAPHALIDGKIKPRDFPCTTEAIIKGDQKSVSIAAASIIAKVYRDNLMAHLAELHPHYGWERNAGYPTREHLQGINTYGIADCHRKSFAPVQNFISSGSVESPALLAI